MLSQFSTNKKIKKWLLSSAVLLGTGLVLVGAVDENPMLTTSSTVYADDWDGDTSTADNAIAQMLEAEINGTASDDDSSVASAGTSLTAYDKGFTLYGDVDNPSLLASYFFTVAQNAEGAIDTNEISLKDMVKYTDNSLGSPTTGDADDSGGGATYGNLGKPSSNYSGSDESYTLANDIKALYQLDLVVSKKPDNVIVGAFKWIADKVVKGVFNAVTGSLTLGQLGATLFDFSNSIISAIGTAIDNLNPVRWFDITQNSLTNGKGFINIFIDTLSKSLGISPATIWGFGRLVIIFVFGAGLIQMMWSLRKSDFRNFLRNNKSFLWRIITIFGMMPMAMGISNTVDSWFDGLSASYNSVNFFSDKYTIDTTKFATTLNLNMSLLRTGTKSGVMTNEEIKQNYSISEDKIQLLNQEIDSRWNTLQGNSNSKTKKKTSGTKAVDLFTEILNPTYVNVDAYSSALRESDTSADIAPAIIQKNTDVSNVTMDLGARGYTTGTTGEGVVFPSRLSTNNFFFIDNTANQSVIQKVKANLAYLGILDADDETIVNLISGHNLYNKIANKNFAYVNKLMGGGALDETEISELGGELSESLTKMIQDGGDAQIFGSNSSRAGNLYYGSIGLIPIYSSNISAMTPKKVSWSAPETYLYGVNKKYGYSNANNYTFANISTSDLTINYISGDLLNFDLTQYSADELSQVVKKSNASIIDSQKSNDDEKTKSREAEAKFSYFMLANARDIALRNKYQGMTNISGTSGYSFSNQGVVILLQSYLKDNTLIFNGVQTVPDSKSSKKQTARDGVTFASLTIPNVGVTDLANRMYYFSATWFSVGVISLIVLITFFKLPFFTAIGEVFVHFFKGQFRGDFTSGLIFLMFFTVLKTSRFFAYLSINIATLASSTFIAWVKELINILGNIETGNFIVDGSTWVAKTVLSGMANNTFLMAILILIVMGYPVMTTQFGKKTVKVPLASIILIMPFIMATAFKESMYSLRAKMYGAKAGTSFLDRVRQRTQMKSASDVAGEIKDGVVNTAKVGAGVALAVTGVGAGMGASLIADGAGGMLGGSDGNALAEGMGADGIVDNTNSGGFSDMIQTFAKPKQIGDPTRELEGLGYDPDNEQIMLREMAEQELREEAQLKEFDELQDDINENSESARSNHVVLNEDGTVYDEQRRPSQENEHEDNGGFIKPVEVEADEDKLNGVLSSAMAVAGAGFAKKLSNVEFKRDENGEIILDEDGKPIIVENVESETETQMAGYDTTGIKESQDIIIPESDFPEKEVDIQKPVFNNVDVEADTANIEGQNVSGVGLERPVTQSIGEDEKPQYVRPDSIRVENETQVDVETNPIPEGKQPENVKPLTREQVRERDKENLGGLGKKIADYQDARYSDKVERKAQQEQGRKADFRVEGKQEYDKFLRNLRSEYERVMKNPASTKEQKREVAQRYMEAKSQGDKLAKEQGVHWTSPVRETKEKVVNTTKETATKVVEKGSKVADGAGKAVTATFDPNTYQRMADSVVKGVGSAKERAKETVTQVSLDMKSGYAKDKAIGSVKDAGQKVIEKTQVIKEKVSEKATEKLVDIRQDLTDPKKIAEAKEQSKHFWKQMIGIDSDNKRPSSGGGSHQEINPSRDRINDRFNIREELRDERMINAMERLAEKMERDND